MTAPLRGALGLALCLVSLAATGSAQAAPPGNDDRADARGLALPASVRGTTVEATVEEIEPPSGCRDSKASVWYRLVAPADRPIVVRLDAGGDLDAVLDVYRPVRSQLPPVACDSGDSRGMAAVRFRATYRVSAEFAGSRRFAPSASGFARLRVVEPIRRK